MQDNMNLQRTKAAQQAQTIRIRPKWHMTALHILYYLIMVVFLVFVRVVTLIFGWLEDEIRSISYRAMSLE